MSLGLLLLLAGSAAGAVPPSHPGIVPAPAAAPGPVAIGAGTSRAPSAAEPASTPPPPPPFDWDPMFFNTTSSTGVDGAGGGGAQLAVDDPGGFAIMFGGATPAVGLTNSTWLVNETTAVWKLLSTPVAPGKRSDFSLASGGACGAAILFGGEVNASTQQSTNDTWLFNFTTKHWRNVTSTVGPAPRQGAAMAVDDASCQAILFGGVNRDYHSGNSTGNVQWNDTWVFSFRNDSWRPVTTLGTPPGVNDAGLLYDNITGVFLMYGGCQSLCSGAIWRYVPSTATWTVLPTAAENVPTPRGGADWSFGWTYGVAVLSMGFSLDGSSLTALNDTFVYEIGANRWDPVGNPTPTPRYDAAGGWLGSNGCPGFVLIGGAGAPTDPPDVWFLDEAPDIPLQCNTWGNDSITPGGGGASGCDEGFFLIVNVTDAATGLPIAGVNVTLGSNCSHASEYSDAYGLVFFLIDWVPYSVVATDTFYHTLTTNYTPSIHALNGTLDLMLTALPDLSVHSYAKYAFGPLVPLPNATLLTGEGVFLGQTNDTGVYEQPGFWPLGIFELFLANATGYGSGQNSSRIPYTGNWTVNITLYAPGPLDIFVEEAGTGVALPGVTVSARSVPTEPLAGLLATTGPTGWANETLSGGNFTLTAELKGFAVLGILPVVEHPWAAVTVVVINMTTDTGYTVDARVIDALTHLPLDGAHVQVGLYPPGETNPAGWANLSQIRPAGTYNVEAWATNYSTNRTAVELSYARPVWILTIPLLPAGSCNTPGAHCNRTVGGSAVSPLTLWPSATPAWTVVAGGGLLLFLLPATALILARRRGGGPGGGPTT